MTPLIIVAAMAGVPFLLALILRVNAIYLFLSLMVGDIFVRYLSDDVALAVAAFVRNFNADYAVNLALLAAPFLLTLFILRKSVPKSKVLLNFVPLLLVSAVFVTLALPLLPGALQNDIIQTPAGDILKNSQDLTMSISAVVILVLVWMNARSKDHAKHGKHHK